MMWPQYLPAMLNLTVRTSPVTASQISHVTIAYAILKQGRTIYGALYGGGGGGGGPHVTCGSLAFNS